MLLKSVCFWFVAVFREEGLRWWYYGRDV